MTKKELKILCNDFGAIRELSRNASMNNIKPSPEEIHEASNRTNTARDILVNELKTACPDTFNIQIKESWGTADITINKSVLDFDHMCLNLTEYLYSYNYNKTVKDYLNSIITNAKNDIKQFFKEEFSL